MTLSRTSSRLDRLGIVVGAAAALLAALPTLANAQIVNRFTTYMHSGPGLEFAVTDEIPNGTPLSPETCQAGWCRINYGGVPGWVQQKTLITGPLTAQPKPGERPTECMDFARTGWPNSGDLQRVCIFPPNKPIELNKPTG
jgi:hypothetical protein